MGELSQPVSEAELKSTATAPRITPEQIKEQIEYIAFSDAYSIMMDGAYKVTDGQGTPLRQREISTAGVTDALHSFTFCMIILKNGFIVTGQSAPVDPTNFSSEIGQRLSYQDAFNKLWPLFGFELKQKLFGERDNDA